MIIFVDALHPPVCSGATSEHDEKDNAKPRYNGIPRYG
jgi:hypothetical protein